MNDADECLWCSNVHAGVCPLVKAYEYYPDGVTVKRVEFKTAVDYPHVQAIPYPVMTATAKIDPWTQTSAESFYDGLGR